MMDDLNSHWQSFLQKPSEKNWQPVYDGMLPYVYTICTRMTGTEEDCRDAVQATFVRVIHEAQLKKIPKDSLPKKVFGQTAGREADALRKRESRRQKREVAMDQLPDSPNAKESKLSIEDRLAIEKIVESLSSDLCVPVQLHFFNGLTHQEIANALDVPRTTISSRIQKALNNLEEKFIKEGYKGPALTLGVIAGSASLLVPASPLSASAIWTKADSMVGPTTATSGASSSLSVGTILKIILPVLVVLSVGITVAVSNQKENRVSASTVAITNNSTQNPVPDSITQSKITIEKADQFVSDKDDRDEINKTTNSFRMTGKITDENGIGIPNARVSMRQSLNWPRDGEHPTVRNEPVTFTDATGHYDLRMIHDSYNMFVVYADGYAANWKDQIQPGKISNPTELNVELEIGRSVSGVVLDEENQPIGNALIFAGPIGGTTTSSSDSPVGSWISPFPNQVFEGLPVKEDGSFKLEDLPSGKFRMMAWAPEMTSKTWVTDADEFQQVVLEEGGVIRGVVAQADSGNQITSFRMAYKPWASYDNEWPSKDNFIEVNSSDGNFMIEGLDRSKSYSVFIEADGYEPHMREMLTPLKKNMSIEDYNLSAEDFKTHTEFGHENISPQRVGFFLNEPDTNIMSLYVYDSETEEPISNALVTSAKLRNNYVYSWDEVFDKIDGEDSDYPDWFTPFSVLSNIDVVYTNEDGFATLPIATNSDLVIGVMKEGYGRVLETELNSSKYKVEDGVFIVPLNKGGGVNLVIPDYVQVLENRAAKLQSSNRPNHWEHDIYKPLDGMISWSSLPSGKYYLEFILSTGTGVGSEKINFVVMIDDHETETINLADYLDNLNPMFRVMNGKEPSKEGTFKIHMDRMGEEYVHRSFETDGFGMYQLTHVKPGRYSIKIMKKIDRREVWSTERIKLVEDNNDIVIDISEQDTEAELYARFLYPDDGFDFGWSPRTKVALLPDEMQLNQLTEQDWNYVQSTHYNQFTNDKNGKYTAWFTNKETSENHEIEKYIKSSTMFNLSSGQVDRSLGEHEIPVLFPVSMTINIADEVAQELDQIPIVARDSQDASTTAGYFLFPNSNFSNIDWKLLPEGKFVLESGDESFKIISNPPVLDFNEFEKAEVTLQVMTAE